jgi:hypothetical protein
MSRLAPALATALILGAPIAPPAAADHAPTIAVPARPGVPIVVHGQDVSWAVIEGDWGLHRPGHGERTVTYGVPILYGPAHGAYFPSLGRTPQLGRREIDVPPARRAPQRYFRSWTSESPPVPATVHPPYAYEPPQVNIERRWRRGVR